MVEGDISWLWGVGFIAFAFGVAVGFLAAYLVTSGDRRVAKLQQELEGLRSEHQAYREEVTDHFRKTSDLFQSLTETYRTVYDHLATGAHTLAAGQLSAPDLPRERLLAEDSGTHTPGATPRRQTGSAFPEDDGAEAEPANKSDTASHGRRKRDDG